MPNHLRPYLWVEFEKVGRLRYLSHLEIVCVFDRAVRRARIPVDYTSGYHPRARISFAPPLPVGAEGRRELCAIDLARAASDSESSAGPIRGASGLLPGNGLGAHDAPTRDLGKALSKQLPVGLNLVSAQMLLRGRRSPFTELGRAEYNVTVDTLGCGREQLAAAGEQFLRAEKVTIERQTKREVRQIDIRPHVYQLELRDKDGQNHLYLDVSFKPETLVKPEETVRALAQMMGPGELRVSRVVRLGMYKA